MWPRWAPPARARPGEPSLAERRFRVRRSHRPHLAERDARLGNREFAFEQRTDRHDDERRIGDRARELGCFGHLWSSIFWPPSVTMNVSSTWAATVVDRSAGIGAGFGVETRDHRAPLRCARRSTMPSAACATNCPPLPRQLTEAQPSIDGGVPSMSASMIVKLISNRRSTACPPGTRWRAAADPEVSEMAYVLQPGCDDSAAPAYGSRRRRRSRSRSRPARGGLRIIERPMVSVAAPSVRSYPAAASAVLRGSGRSASPRNPSATIRRPHMWRGRSRSPWAAACTCPDRCPAPFG